MTGRGIREPHGDRLPDVPAPPDARQLLDRAVIDEPYEFYEALREHAPVWEVPGTDIVTVGTFALVAEAAGRVGDFSSHIDCLLYRDADGLPARLPLGAAGVQALATADPPVHAEHRDTVFPSLVAARMAELEPDIAALADERVRRSVDEGSVEFMSVVGTAVPIAVISRLIGFRDSDPGQLLQAALDSTAMLGSTVDHDGLLALMLRSAEIQEWVGGQLAGALAEPTDGLLGTVADGVRSGTFSEFEAVVVLHTLLSAGGESTASLLGNAVRILAERPDLQADLREDPGLIPPFIEEALRLEPPFRFHLRSVPHDTALGGVEVPAGATVLLLWGSANRDPATFERAGSVDLARRVPRRHVAFGRGIHHCVGAPLARTEAGAVLRALLARTSEFTLDPDRPPRWANSLMVRRHDELPLRLAPA